MTEKEQAQKELNEAARKKLVLKAEHAKQIKAAASKRAFEMSVATKAVNAATNKLAKFQKAEALAKAMKLADQTLEMAADAAKPDATEAP